MGRTAAQNWAVGAVRSTVENYNSIFKDVDEEAGSLPFTNKLLKFNSGKTPSEFSIKVGTKTNNYEYNTDGYIIRNHPIILANGEVEGISSFKLNQDKSSGLISSKPGFYMKNGVIQSDKFAETIYNDNMRMVYHLRDIKNGIIKLIMEAIKSRIETLFKNGVTFIMRDDRAYFKIEVFIENNGALVRLTYSVVQKTKEVKINDEFVLSEYAQIMPDGSKINQKSLFEYSLQ